MNKTQQNMLLYKTNQQQVDLMQSKVSFTTQRWIVFLREYTQSVLFRLHHNNALSLVITMRWHMSSQKASTYQHHIKTVSHVLCWPTYSPGPGVTFVEKNYVVWFILLLCKCSIKHNVAVHTLNTCTDCD